MTLTNTCVRTLVFLVRYLLPPIPNQSISVYGNIFVKNNVIRLAILSAVREGVLNAINVINDNKTSN